MAPISIRTALAATALVGGLGFAASTPAQAVPLYTITETPTGGSQGNPSQATYDVNITNTPPPGTSNTFNLNWSAPTNPGTPTDVVSATATVTVDSFTTTDLTITVSLKNTSTFPTDARIVDFGIDASPNVTGVSFTAMGAGTVLDQVSTDSVPSFSQVNVCAFSGNNCSGGGNTGLIIGASDTFTLDIKSTSFGTASDLSADLADFALKYQGSNPLSFEIPGVPTPGGGGGSGTGTVPEPSSILVMGIGLLGLGYVMRRRARR
jgi:hypothetical protein